MKRVKKRTFMGAVCEQEVFYIRENQDIAKAEPKERFDTEEERTAHKIGISRRKHAKLVNANFDSDSQYSTLTFNDENEVYDPQLAKKLRSNYIRKLKRKYPDTVIFVYIGFGKNTHRLHMHMLSKGIPAEDIKRLWSYGEIVRVDNLREHNTYNGVDHGEDYTAVANYLFDHWTPEIGGHRWFNTRNAARPTEEKPTLVVRNYSETHPPTAPKGYMLVDTYINKYGYMRFTYVKKPESRYITRKRKREKEKGLHI